MTEREISISAVQRAKKHGEIKCLAFDFEGQNASQWTIELGTLKQIKNVAQPTTNPVTKRLEMNLTHEPKAAATIKTFLDSRGFFASKHNKIVYLDRDTDTTVVEGRPAPGKNIQIVTAFIRRPEDGQHRKIDCEDEEGRQFLPT